MRSKCAVLLLTLIALLGLQHGIKWLNSHVSVRQQQAAIISSRDIDPGALFYTESALALRAAHTVSDSIAEQRRGE